MDTEIAKKRVSLVGAILTSLGVFLASVGGTVAWATQFQTKIKAAEQSARVDTIEKAQERTSTQVSNLDESVKRIDTTTQRLDDKLDKVLLRLSVRR